MAERGRPGGESRSRSKVIIAIVLAIVVLGLGTMLLIGLLSGDDVDREENPVRGVGSAAAEQHEHAALTDPALELDQPVLD